MNSEYPWGVIAAGMYPDCGEVDYVVIGESDDGAFADPVMAVFGDNPHHAQTRAQRILDAVNGPSRPSVARAICYEHPVDSDAHEWLPFAVHMAPGDHGRQEYYVRVVCSRCRLVTDPRWQPGQ